MAWFERGRKGNWDAEIFLYGIEEVKGEEGNEGRDGGSLMLDATAPGVERNSSR